MDDDSEKPTIETEGLAKREAEAAWQMPEPIFRSTTGTTPGEEHHDPEKDIPTEPANKTEQSVRVKENALGTRHKKRKGGCAKFFTLLAVLVGVIVGLIILTAVYFLFYYRPTSTAF